MSQSVDPDQLVRPANLAPHGPTPVFGVLVSLFEACLKKKLEYRKKFLSRWIAHWRKQVGQDLYPVLRLILPHKDRERATYGFKEANLAKAFIAAFGLNEKSHDAQSLIHWKKPDEGSKAAGDFPTVLYQTLAARSSVTQGTMTIDELNKNLDELSQTFRVSSKDPEKKSVVSHIFRAFSEKCTPSEIRWISRIILKDLSVGMKENTVFAVFHPDAMDLYNSCSDLQRICYDLADPSKRLNETDKNIKLFKPFQPMLCGKPKSTEEAVRMMSQDKNDKGWIMEEKLDGERIQLHKRGSEFYFCSRKGKDYTYLYGSNVGTGSLTPFIKRAFDPRVTDVILDGEMMVYDPMLEKYLPFGNLKTFAASTAQGSDKPRPCFKVFDILHINLAGSSSPTVLSRKTLSVRLGVLKDENMKLFTEIPGRLEFALQREGERLEDAEEFLQEIVEARGEGLVLKKKKSIYQLGGRDSRAWVKLKPEYMDSMGETVDVLVVAAHYGSGRRGGRLSSIICAVRDDIAESSSNGAMKYRTFARVGSGLSFEDYEWVNGRNWKPYDRNAPPPWLTVSTMGLDDKGDVYIEPEDSFIMTIKAAQITPTDMYGCAKTLRFPRCKSLRRDLGVDDCLTLSEMLDMASGKRKAANEEANPEQTKKRKVTRRRKGLLVNDAQKGASTEDSVVQSELFKGMKFHVISASGVDTSLSKQQVETMLKEHGGMFVQAPKFADYVLYAGEKNMSHIEINFDPEAIAVNSVKKADQKDIIHPKWILDSVQEGRKLDLVPLYFFHMTKGRARATNDDDLLSDSERGSLIRMDDDEGEETEEEEEEDAKHVLPKEEDHDVEENEWIRLADNEEDEAASWRADRKAKKEEDSETEDDGVPTDDGETTESEADLDVGDEASERVEKEEEKSLEEDEDVKMGENDVDQEYDPDQIFKHLVFYMDSVENADANQLEVQEEAQSQHDQSDAKLRKAAELIRANGGRVSDRLDDPKLTHIVLFKGDRSRRVELMRRTQKPRRRYLVLTTFVDMCVQEQTLLDEDGFTA